MRVVVFVVALFCSATCFAGAEQTFECRHCDLKGKYVQGNLMFARQIVAFCSNKDHVISIPWDYKNRGPKPAKFDRGVPVYVCPMCNTPTARKWDEKQCPRCGSKNIRIRRTGLMVD